jgi:hypothetical protein
MKKAVEGKGRLVLRRETFRTLVLTEEDLVHGGCKTHSTSAALCTGNCESCVVNSCRCV